MLEKCLNGEHISIFHVCIIHIHSRRSSSLQKYSRASLIRHTGLSGRRNCTRCWRWREKISVSNRKWPHSLCLRCARRDEHLEFQRQLASKRALIDSDGRRRRVQAHNSSRAGELNERILFVSFMILGKRFSFHSRKRNSPQIFCAVFCFR